VCGWGEENSREDGEEDGEENSRDEVFIPLMGKCSSGCDMVVVNIIG
jgi:hypothetical protein